MSPSNVKTLYQAERIAPNSPGGGGVSKSHYTERALKEAIVRDLADKIMEKVEFQTSTQDRSATIKIVGRVHIASQKEMESLVSVNAAKYWGADINDPRADPYHRSQAATMPSNMTASGIEAAHDKRVAQLAGVFKGTVDSISVKEVYNRARWYGTRVSYTQIGELIMSEKFWQTGAQFEGEQSEIQKLDPVHVLIDGDIVAYRCAATCDGRYYEVAGKRYGYKKDAVSAADKLGIPNAEIMSGYEPEPVDAALHNIAVTIENIKNYFIYELKKNPHIKMFLSGKTNFRYDLFPEYKAHRKDKRRPHHLVECKNYLIDQFEGHCFEGFEADDLIAMTTNTFASEKQEAVYICSNDKDFTQLSGERVWQYDFTTGKCWQVTEQQAMHYFYKQILIGDSSDGVPGLPRVGSQTAIKILEGETEERGLYNKVVIAYQNKLKIDIEKAIEMVDLRGKLLWLMRKEGEMWSPPPPRNPV